MERTKDFTVGDTKIDVADLPKEIREVVEFYDKARNEYITLSGDIDELTYRRDIVGMALVAIRSQITGDVNALTQSKSTPTVPEVPEPPMPDNIHD